MKKLFALIIALSMFLTLTACVFNDNDQNSAIDGDDTENGESENLDSSENESAGGDTTGGEEDDNKIDPARITYITDFSEDKAFVRYGDLTSAEYRTVYCIDKTGKILFTLENIGAGAGISSFCNGLAAIEMEENDQLVVWLCNEKGEFIKPSDVGATCFSVDPSELYLRTLFLFADGYILAENTVTDFRGSTTKMAILNADLEVVVDYSEELYERYEAFAHCSYYNGYLYEYDRTSEKFGGALNLKNGERIENFATVVGSVERAFPSDLWVCKDSCYMDIATGKVTVDLKEYSDTNYTTYDFNCGIAPILFRVDKTEFLGIVLENGSLAFEPVELKGSGATVYADGGKVLVLSANGNEAYAETFDTSGKLGELTFNSNGQWVNASICDDVVAIAIFGADTKYMLYTVNLQPLF